jgi:hypothetical protein
MLLDDLGGNSGHPVVQLQSSEAPAGDYLVD